MYIAYAQELEYNVVQVLGEEQIEPITSTPLEQSEGVVLSTNYLKDGYSCMRYLTQVKGLEIWGDAINVQPNVSGPITGGVVLFHYPNGVGHASYIDAILLNNSLLVSEWNYYEGEYSQRVIRLDDPAIYGYFYVNPNLDT